MKKRKTLLIYYLSLGAAIGGIERYLLNLISELKKENEENRIIMITHDKITIKEEYKSILDNVEKVYLKNHLNFMSCENISFNENEEVLVLTFYLVNFFQIEELKKKYPRVKIHNVCWVPHFDPAYVFPDTEEWIPKVFRKFFYRTFRGAVIQMENNNNIFYLNKRHLNAFEQHYNYKVKDSEKKVSHSFSNRIYDFDKENLLKKHKSKRFNILSVGRFEFPHKGYILGLVDAFAELKKKYENLTLTLIGEGTHQGVLLNKIEALPENIKSDIILPGPVIGEKLKDFSDEANLCVCVAGALTLLAAMGNVMIQARLYDNSCECYGFWNEEIYEKKHLSVERGESILPYIERVINSTEDEYVSLSFDSYSVIKNHFKDKERGHILDIMDFDNIDTLLHFDQKTMFAFKLHNYMFKIYVRTIGRIKRILKRILQTKKNLG